ncbi:unnamed protein product, partial [Closterium sp. NIES-65]
LFATPTLFGLCACLHVSLGGASLLCCQNALCNAVTYSLMSLHGHFEAHRKSPSTLIPPLISPIPHLHPSVSPCVSSHSLCRTYPL